ncbi:hypothetical protein C8J56DRAFT_1030768 [Mycena floridula]|nr:hypothetical protein C8J56DRAFT_1030768 [Mycena floridula]
MPLRRWYTDLSLWLEDVVEANTFKMACIFARWWDAELGVVDGGASRPNLHSGFETEDGVAAGKGNSPDCSPSQYQKEPKENDTTGMNGCVHRRSGFDIRAAPVDSHHSPIEQRKASQEGPQRAHAMEKQQKQGIEHKQAVEKPRDLRQKIGHD